MATSQDFDTVSVEGSTETEGLGEFVKRVLDLAYLNIIEKLEPDCVLRIFKTDNLFNRVTNIKIRDIMEQKTTSDKNREIQNLFRRNPNKYIDFKKSLVETAQIDLLRDLEHNERTEHDKRKESKNPCGCSIIEACPFLTQLGHRRLEVSTSKRAKTANSSDEDLQAWLITHYTENHLDIPSPFEDDDVRLKHMYVDPSFNILRESKGHDGLRKVNDHSTNLSCRKIFTTKDYNCRKIYVTGDAGTGKSVLCQQLVRLWCEAHTDNESHSDGEDSDSESHSDEEESDSGRHSDEGNKKETREDRTSRRKENRKILHRFKFVFYLKLRDCCSTCEVTEMIQNQILRLCKSIEGLDASHLLETHCCLIIFDGLDEWVCPKDSRNSGIPERDYTNVHSVVLTTTRPWKFDVLQIKSSECDKHIELCELANQSASELCSNLLKLLSRDKTCRKKSKDFFRTLEEKGLGSFKTTPVFLLQLIYLWFDNQEISKSQVQLYCAMINLMLKTSLKNLSEQTTNTQSVVTETPLPKCIMDYPYCQKHRQILYCLSKLAFKALFDKTKENRLVFESSKKEIYDLGQEAIDLCLKSGILSQSKVLDKVSVSEKKMSFLHKKLQEFLAAIYIAGSVDSGGVFKRVFKKSSNKQIKHMTDFCSTIDTCLEMSQVYMFLSGLRQDLTQQLLTHITHVVTADKHKQIQKYRQTLLEPGLIQDIQTCITDCVVEGSYYDYKYVKLCSTDFYITKTTLCHVEPLFLCTKSSKVKSVCIETEDIDSDQLTAITSQLLQCHSVQKLYLNDLEPCCIHDDTLTQIVNNNINTLTCLSFGSVIIATDKLVTAICSISSECLMALALSVNMTHKHIEQIIARFSQSPTIRQLGLLLVCTDHDRQCRPRIDLSTMTHIQRLDLYYMSVNNLQSVSHYVEHVILGDVTLPVTALHEFTHSISQTTRYVEVELSNVTLTQVTDRQFTQVIAGQVTQVTDRQITEVTDGQVDMKTFLCTFQGLNVTKCWYDDSDKTWSIDFTTNPQ